MAQKTGLSIRYKILMLLTLLPIVTLALFLVMALDIFEEDKVAYVFESSSSVSKTLATQTSTNLSSVLNSAKPIMQEFISDSQFGMISKSLFESESVVDWIAVYEKQDSRFVGKGIIEREANAGRDEISKLSNLSIILAEAELRNRVVHAPFKDEKIVLVEKVSVPGGGDKYFVIGATLKDVSDLFTAPSVTQLMLVNEFGEIIYISGGNEATQLAEKTDSSFMNRVKTKKFYPGTEKITTAAGVEWLVSFSKVAFGNLYVINMTPKDEALAAVQSLLKKSIVFFLFLISATVVVSLLASSSLTAALTELFHATQKVAEGHFDIRVQVKSSDEIGSLATSFNAMAEEVSRLLLETAEKARMESELKTAQTVQETLFPPDRAELGNIEVAGHYEPASECGGDWWHYCQVGSKVFLWIGDATGHGAPAALITSAAKSAATIIEKLDVTPAQALSLLNRAIYDVSKGKIMMTFFLACFDHETNILTYANASHEAPFLIKKQNEPLKKKNLIPLNEVNNPRLGQSRDTEYQQTQITLDKEDRVFFYTDGLPDIHNPEKQPWGEREFIKSIITNTQDYPPVHISVSKIVDQFSSYRQNATLIDDITFFMCHFK